MSSTRLFEAASISTTSRARPSRIAMQAGQASQGSPSRRSVQLIAFAKIRAIDAAHDPARGAPVFTVEGIYTSRGWTEWTEGFQLGSAILQFDATGDAAFLELGRARTVERMAVHVTHAGVDSLC